MSSSRGGAVPDNHVENQGWSPSLLPSTEPTTLAMSRKRPREHESPEYHSSGGVTMDGRSRSRRSRGGRVSFAPESRGVISDTYPAAREHLPSMRRRYSFTIPPPIKTEAEEVNIRDMSATVEAELERGDDGGGGHNTGGSSHAPQTLPPSFREPLSHLRQKLHDIDHFFLHRLRSDARRYVDVINQQINVMEDSHRRLYSDFCNERDQKKEFQDRLSQLKYQAEATTQERDRMSREIEELKKTTAKLQASIKDLEGSKMELASSIKDLEHRNESLKAEKEKLAAVVVAKNAEIEALKASPVSVVAPGALTEHGASDSLPQGLSLSVSPAHTTTPAVADAGGRHTHHKYEQLGFGITSFLDRLLKMEIAHDNDQPSSDGRRLNSVVVDFMSNLGSLAANTTTNVAVSPAEGFWRLVQPWTLKPAKIITPRSSIEERFVQLCFLISHLKSRSRADTWPTAIRLINLLMKSDHASAPHAGMAFLATMRSTNPVVKVQNVDVRNAALAIALCELCRFLQETFTELLLPEAKAKWDIGNILGSTISATTPTPIGRLGACLANLHRSDTLALRRQLAATCGDKFCFSSAEGLGFLSCDDNETFLLLDLEKRTIRFVDRNFAYALLGEDEKKHLWIKGSDGKVLLDIPDAAHHVRKFWINYAERPDPIRREEQLKESRVK